MIVQDFERFFKIPDRDTVQILHRNYFCFN